MKPYLTLTGCLATLILATCSGTEGNTCESLCGQAVECLRDRVSRDDQTIAPDETLLLQARKACLDGCGGPWESAGLADPQALCTDVSGPAILTISPEPGCAALIHGKQECHRLEGEEAREDCRFTVDTVQAVAGRDPALCASLSPPRSSFCEAVSADEVHCPPLPSLYMQICNELRDGAPRHDYTRLLQAIRQSDPAQCSKVLEKELATACGALLAGSDGECLHIARIDLNGLAQLGSAWHKDRTDATVASSSSVPHLLSLLKLLAVLFWILLPLWAGSALVKTWKDSRGTAAVLTALCVACMAVPLFFLPHGPLNFVEFERLFVPGDEDLGRLAYSGFSLVLRPLFLLFSASYPLVIAVNSFLLGLLPLGLFSLAMRLTGSRTASLLAAMAMAATPSLLRMGATGSETVGFALIALVWFDLLLAQNSDFKNAAQLVFWTVLAVCFRPEGVFLFLPGLVLVVMRGRMQPDWLRVAGWVGLAGSALVFLAFITLYLRLPRPAIPWALVPEHAGLLVMQLFNPWWYSPVVLAGVLAAAFRPAHFTPAAVWVLVLLVLWAVQGPEGNQVFGSARYFVILTPWLILGWARVIRWGLDRWGLRSGCALAAALVLFSLPQTSLLWVESNTQMEFDFTRQVASKLAANDVIILASAPAHDQQFTPEAGMLAAVALEGKEATWMPLRQFAPTAAQACSGEGPRRIVVDLFYRHGEALEVLRTAGVPWEPLIEFHVASIPDVAWFDLVPAGTDVILAAYRVCP